ncbi:hypothetical protein SynMITS9220_02397 [Synechococcus sp. MIT S9220]|nr:hypothetical protein SynMITS9220_02397 [Synechococcus sp. MIT S9220]
MSEHSQLASSLVSCKVLKANMLGRFSQFLSDHHCASTDAF